MTDFTNTDNAFIKLRERTEYSGRHGKGNPAGGCGTAVSVLNAYTNTVLQILRGGNTVKFGELGTFLHHRQRNGGKRNRQACAYRKFSAPQILKSAVQSKNISANLNAIVKSIQEIVSATSHAEDSFSQMVKDISTSQDLVAQITLSVQEQNEGGKQVLQALGDIQAITIHIADSSSEMNQGTDRILHTLKRLTELSKQVQGNSDTMSRNTQNIHQSLALIHAVIESNDATVQKLNTHAGQFTV